MPRSTIFTTQEEMSSIEVEILMSSRVSQKMQPHTAEASLLRMLFRKEVVTAASQLGTKNHFNQAIPN